MIWVMTANARGERPASRYNRLRMTPAERGATGVWDSWEKTLDAASSSRSASIAVIVIAERVSSGTCS